MAIVRIVSVTLLAGSMMAMAGAARADATQPGVMRPEVAQVIAASDCEMATVRVASDDSLFGTERADGVR